MWKRMNCNEVPYSFLPYYCFMCKVDIAGYYYKVAWFQTLFNRNRGIVLKLDCYIFPDSQRVLADKDHILALSYNKGFLGYHKAVRNRFPYYNLNVHAINESAVIPEFCPDFYHACFIDLGIYLGNSSVYQGAVVYERDYSYRHPFVNEAKFRFDHRELNFHG